MFSKCQSEEDFKYSRTELFVLCAVFSLCTSQSISMITQNTFSREFNVKQTSLCNRQEGCYLTVVFESKDHRGNGRHGVSPVLTIHKRSAMYGIMVMHILIHAPGSDEF